MKIVLATGIFPPEIGGPAQYAASLKDALERQGNTVSVVVLNHYKRFPPGLKQICFATKLFRVAHEAGLIIAFDVHAVGLLAMLAGRMRKIPVVVRAGGDFVWEHYVNRTRERIPLTEFYRHPVRWNTKELVAFSIKRSVLKRVSAVFSSRWLADIWKEPYKLEQSRVHVIENAVPPKLEPITPARKNFIFFARQIPLKNADAFRRAFAKAKLKYPDIVLEEGTLPHAELIERIRSCYAAVVPSVSEVTPNYIIDAIRSGKPFLLTKYSGYAQRFKEYGVLVDPLSEDDMARGVEALADSATYEKLRTHTAQFNEVRTYDDIAREFIALLK